MTRRWFAALSLALALVARIGPAVAGPPCDLSILFTLRHERAPEYSYMSDMEYALMVKEKVDQARKYGKAKAKLVGLASRHFPEYADLEVGALIERIDAETRAALRCFEARE